MRKEKEKCQPVSSKMKVKTRNAKIEAWCIKK
jgi:hypothetical protein